MARGMPNYNELVKSKCPRCGEVNESNVIIGVKDKYEIYEIQYDMRTMYCSKHCCYYCGERWLQPYKEGEE